MTNRTDMASSKVASAGALAAPRAARGVGLVEVMVALLILSIGLLGIASLYMTGLRMAQEAYFHSQATLLSQDLIDRMRANRRAVATGAYERPAFAASEQAPSCEPIGLNGDIATQDIALWTQALACALPEGDGTVVHRGDGVYRVVVRWRTRDEDGDGFVTEATEVQL